MTISELVLRAENSLRKILKYFRELNKDRRGLHRPERLKIIFGRPQIFFDEINCIKRGIV